MGVDLLLDFVSMFLQHFDTHAPTFDEAFDSERLFGPFVVVLDVVLVVVK